MDVVDSIHAVLAQACGTTYAKCMGHWLQTVQSIGVATLEALADFNEFAGLDLIHGFQHLRFKLD